MILNSTAWYFMNSWPEWTLKIGSVLDKDNNHLKPGYFAILALFTYEVFVNHCVQFVPENFSDQSSRRTGNPGSALELRQPDLASPWHEPVGHQGEGGDEELVRVRSPRGVNLTTLFFAADIPDHKDHGKHRESLGEMTLLHNGFTRFS